MKKILTNQEQMVIEIKIQKLAQQNLETKMGKLAQAQNTRPQEGLPHDLEQNPKKIMEITFKSGRYLIDIYPNKNHKV